MKFKALSVILVLTLLLSACSLLSPKTKFKLSEGEAAFHFIDVGQGDCTLIQTKDAAILIDTGIYEKGEETVNYIKKLGIKEIDCLILTHPHEDHIGGAADILKNFAVGTVYINSDTGDSYAYERLIDEISKQELKLVLPNTDCIYEYGKLRIKFISPQKDYADENHNSIITMVTFGSKKFLFMGDADTEVESDLLNAYDLNADVLKVGHHGSRYASHYEFLNSVLPEISVISCGENNSYGHPHKETLDRLDKIGSTILRTDINGTICLKTDGEKIYKPNGEIFSCSAHPAELIYIGNKRAKVFHTEMCTGLPQEQNQIIFKSKTEAEDAGYKPCRNCNP